MGTLRSEEEALTGALRLEHASVYLGLEPGSRWLLESDCPVSRCDIRKPGSRRPVWVWRVVDLDAFLLERLVPAGRFSAFDENGY